MSPTSLPWLETLHKILLRFHLPVQDIVLTQPTLTIDLATHPPLTVLLREEKVPNAYAHTRRFSMQYHGQSDVPATTSKILDRLLQALRRIENSLPPLEGIGGYFTTQPPADIRFLRLFPFCTVEYSFAGTTPITEVLVRTTSRCNQRCPFCTAPTHDEPPSSVMTTLLQELPHVFPNAMVSFTGGEPTLRPRFLQELTLALQQPLIRSLQVQTNAVYFANRWDPLDIPPQDNLSFFVSLVALQDDIYDRCTATQGQLPLALAGIRRLILAEHHVTLNFVINAWNVDHMTSYVQQLPHILPLSPKVELHFSSLICPSSKQGLESLLVPYTRVVKHLRQVSILAQEVGIPLQSLRASTHASIPPCVLDPEERARDPHRPVILAHETGLLSEGRPWVKGLSCKKCAETQWCLGVPRPYAIQFGLDELVPLKEDS